MRRLARWFLPLLAAPWACNAVLGIEEGYLAGDTPNDCVLNSDCKGSGQVCLFRVCSPPCAEDQDCAHGARCVKTSDGVACAAADAASCGDGVDCPSGTECRGGTCRISCSDDGDCLGDQRCDTDVCVGSDPNHDPLGSGGTGGSGGSGGMAGSTGSGASSGMGGSAGAGGSSGSGGAPPTDCQTNDKRCNDRGLQETCDAEGRWGEGTACPFVCSEGECVGECVPEDRDCLLGVTPRTCDELGAWQAGEDCAAVCVEGECAPSCTTGDHQCSGLDVLVCNADGVFEHELTCPYRCDPVSKACTGMCTPNSQQCMGNLLQICGNDASWSTLATCPFVCTARAGMPGQFECSGECVPGTTQCESATELRTCNANGRWDPTTTCVNQACGGSPAQCRGQCSPGSVSCSSSSVLQRCDSSGTYVTMNCAAQNQTCVAAAGSASCAGSCAPGQQHCTGNTLQSCNAAGSFADTQNCTSSNQTCVEEAGASARCLGVCAPGQTSCVNNDAYSCAGGSFSTLTDDCAAPNEICSAGACVANTPYTVGQASATNWVDFNPANNLWYVVPIQIQKTANVVAIRIIGRAAGGLARMAMWQNNAGKPGTFMAQTDNISVTNGVAGDAPIPLATQVVAGQVYWVGAKFTNNAALYQSSGTQLVYTYDQVFGDNPATTLNPFPAGAAGTVPNLALNFFLLVQDVSL